MNKHTGEAAKFSRFAEYSRKYQPIISPCWFNPEIDTLFMRNGFVNVSQYLARKQVTISREPLRYLAIEMSQDDSDLQPGELWIGGWLGGLRFSVTPTHSLLFNTEKGDGGLASLQSLTLLFPGKCEVIVMTRGDEQGLRDDEWCFSLDTESQAFCAEMGQQWSRATWRVKLGNKQSRTPLWHLITKWNVEFSG